MNNLEIIQAAVRVAAANPNDTRGIFLLVRDLLDVQDNTTAEQLLVSLLAAPAPKAAERKPAFMPEATKQALQARRIDQDMRNMPARAYDAMMKVACPTCFADPGGRCVTAGGSLLYDGVHAGRLRAFTGWIATEGMNTAQAIVAERRAKLAAKRVRAIDVGCPMCNAKPGHPCFEMTSAGAYGKPTDVLRSEGYHRSRYQHAKKRMGNATT